MEELKIKNLAKDPESKKYSLIQYTEHIHFQAREEGACLRGTEVKPKLDKFIHHYCEKHNTVLPKSCFLMQPGDSLLSLRYAVSISPKISEEKKCNMPKARTTTFFANEGNAKEFKESVFYSNGYDLKINCPAIPIKVDIEGRHFGLLMDLIDYVLPAFFALTCFGTRSTKGFGSYAVQGRKADDAYLKQFVPVYYRIEFTGKRNEMPEIIKTISNMMKAGINNSYQNKNGAPPDDYYYKGRIFRYFTEKSVGSDKAFMKQKLLPGKDLSLKSEEKKRYKDFCYSRGILGLAPLYEFRRSYGSTREGKVTVEDGASGKNTIERFNNPIHFKPNGDVLLIIPTEIPQIMGGHSFSFEADNGNKKTLSTPSVSSSKTADPGAGEFNLVAFLDYFMRAYNSQNDMIASDRRIKKMFVKLTINHKLARMSKVGG